MSAKERSVDISKPLASIYLLYGTESYLMNRLREQIIQTAMSREERTFNLSVYDLRETAIEAALEDAETLSLIGGHKVVVLEHPFFLADEGKKEKIEHRLDRLEAYLNDPSPDTTVVFCAPYAKLDRRKKIVKNLEAKADVRDCSEISDAMLFDWLSEEAKKEGAIYTEAAHRRLVAMVGSNIATLVNEVRKIALYAGEGGTIDEDAVDRLAARTLESDVFAMVDRVMTGDLSAAYRLLTDLLKQKEDPVKLCALVMRQIRLAYRTALYRRQGYGERQIAALLNVHPYAVKVAAGQGRRFGEDRLRKALLYCAEADEQLKSSALDKTVVLQLLFERLAAV
jgi:DNA polymerase-3 subunit delta